MSNNWFWAIVLLAVMGCAFIGAFMGSVEWSVPICVEVEND